MYLLLCPPKADQLPYPDESFDLAISRRGPASDIIESTTEAYRVLRKGGQLMLQEIGERDKQNWARIFGRGQMYPATVKVAVELEKRLAHAGFEEIVAEEFEANEYFASNQDALMRLENSPIIPILTENSTNVTFRKSGKSLQHLRASWPPSTESSSELRNENRILHPSSSI